MNHLLYALRCSVFPFKYFFRSSLKEQIADWVVCQQEGDPTYLDDEKQFSMKIHKTLHSGICYGRLQTVLNDDLGNCLCREDRQCVAGRGRDCQPRAFNRTITLRT